MSKLEALRGMTVVVADTGDNDAKRDEASLHIVLEPDLADDDKIKLDPAWSIDFRYPDGPRDVEAVVADPASERIFLLRPNPHQNTS